MTIGEGKFVLYSRIEPPLEAGDYRFTAHQALTATGLGEGDLPVADLPTHVTVRSPRFSMPPDQILSTFPPAGSEGSYGARLPQVVIKRRTLPWERSVQTGVPRSTPWLALVLIAEGEAELKLNQPVAQCITPGKTLPGKADSELGNYLQIRKSVVDRVFPTQLDVPLLAHAREVDIHDTEMMMGDDDGFLAVVIANRLPLAGRDEHGNEVPSKYLACLINLEGQFTDLLERAPEPVNKSPFPAGVALVKDVVLAERDHARMDTTSTATVTPKTSVGKAPYAPKSMWTAVDEPQPVSNVYTEMARDFSSAVTTGFVAGDHIVFDPTLRFPVLLHWSFTSYGNVTFRSLMEELDSGLLGTTKPEQTVEVVETGHVGLDHRTRVGDPVRSWYRGPFTPNPTNDDRLALAHAADQLRIIIADGREDISLAAAFEIGRLLALSRPSMVSALLRWRQTGYQFARRTAVWGEFSSFLGALGAKDIDPRIGVHLGRSLAKAVTQSPELLLGNPAPLVRAGRALNLDGSPESVLAKGFGLQPEVFRGTPSEVLTRLRNLPVVRAPESNLPPDALSGALGAVVDRMVSQVGKVMVPGDRPGGRFPGIPGIPGGPDLPGRRDLPGGPDDGGGPAAPGVAGGPAGPHGPVRPAGGGAVSDPAGGVAPAGGGAAPTPGTPGIAGGGAAPGGPAIGRARVEGALSPVEGEEPDAGGVR